MKTKLLLVLALLQTPVFLFAQHTIAVDVCVYGGTSGGVMAAYTARKMGKTIVLIEPGKHVGGLLPGGLALLTSVTNMR
jgi:NADPH-dependent 2,4-dienoyl-CoA reductase/sulfur reductase-like enzyme